MKERRKIDVGIGHCIVSGDTTPLTVLGLGSCVALIIYDRKNKIGCLAHIILPKRSEAVRQDNPFKFADTSVPLMLKKLEHVGAERRWLIAKIAGGAKLFSFTSSEIDVGERNVEAVRDALSLNRIRIGGEDVGGTCGRTVIFYPESGVVVVRTLLGEERVF